MYISKFMVCLFLSGSGDIEVTEKLPITPNYLVNPPFPYLEKQNGYKPLESSVPSIPVATMNHNSNSSFQDGNFCYFMYIVMMC